MKNKKIMALLISIIITFLICEINFYIEMKKQEKSIIETDLNYFEPSSQNNILKIYETGFKINENLPKIEAASAFYPFTANLVQKIYSEDAYWAELLKMVSTSQAFEDIIDGKTDIIIATEPSDKQKEMIEKSGVNLEFKTIYLEPLAILLNNDNSMDNLSIEQIQDIYYNNKSNWNTYQLEKNNGSQTCFEKIVKNNALVKNHYEINTMPKIIDKVGLDKKGIGYSFYSYCSKMHINNNVKIISVNGKNINDEDYPLLFEVYLIYRTDNHNENIFKILDCLKTENGQESIEFFTDSTI